MRPTWDEASLNIAVEVAKRSTCDRAHVGVVLVRGQTDPDHRAFRPPSGLSHCDIDGHLLVEGHCVRTIDAENERHYPGMSHGVSTKGATR